MNVILCSMVLHELMVPTVMLDEMNRILKPGGVAIIYDWMRFGISDYFNGEKPINFDQLSHFSEHCRYTGDDLQWLCEQSGLKTLEWMGRKQSRQILMAVEKL